MGSLLQHALRKWKVKNSSRFISLNQIAWRISHPILLSQVIGGDQFRLWAAQPVVASWTYRKLLLPLRATTMNNRPQYYLAYLWRMHWRLREVIRLSIHQHRFSTTSPGRMPVDPSKTSKKPRNRHQRLTYSRILRFFRGQCLVIGSLALVACRRWTFHNIPINYLGYKDRPCLEAYIPES